MTPPSAHPTFGAVSTNEWRLSDDLQVDRRKRLLQGLTFEEIVAAIARGIESVEMRRERAKKDRRFYRPTLRLRVDPELIDQFHNSARGYRAQYYIDAKLGEHANDHIVRSIGARLGQWPSSCFKATCPRDWVSRSLLTPGAKVWIHQGLWLRRAKCSDALIAVPRWIAEVDSADDRRRKLARWSRLLPCSEAVLELKGGFINADSAALGSLKQTRPRELYELGFT